MSLERIPYPSPNYSSRGGAQVRLIVLHTAEGARTGIELGNFFANPAAGVSSHVGIDDTVSIDADATVYEYVRRDWKSWTAANANPVAVQAELCAFAEWGSTEWNQHPQMLANTAAWIAEEAQAFGIPIVKLSAAEAQGSGRGVCQHNDLGSWGGGHWDCGPNFPIDDVLAMAGGAAPAVPSPPPGPVGVAPPWPGRLFIQPPAMYGEDVRQWQTQMAEVRGWQLMVDGWYGSQSEQVCYQFQVEKGLDVDGVVGEETWAAAWELPVT